MNCSVVTGEAYLDCPHDAGLRAPGAGDVDSLAGGESVENQSAGINAPDHV